MSVYTRDTELRHVKPNDIYKLGIILNEDNCWMKLLESIPKGLDNHIFSQSDIPSIHKYLDNLMSTRGRKYTNDHVHILEDAVRRSGESRLLAQILFDEWSISGRKHERPTVGVLLHLLIKAELFRAADFVAESILKESLKFRPETGPGTKVDTTLPSELFNDIQDIAFDSRFYPSTGALNNQRAEANNDNNKDFYVKYRSHVDRDKSLMRQDSDDQNSNGNGTKVDMPKPPPRLIKLAKLRQSINGEGSLQQQQSGSTGEVLTESSGNSRLTVDSHDLPKLSVLVPADKTSDAMEDPLSAATSATATSNSTQTTSVPVTSDDSLPLLSILLEPEKYEVQSEPKYNFINGPSSGSSNNPPRANEGNSMENPVNFELEANKQLNNESSTNYSEDIELTDIPAKNKYQRQQKHLEAMQTAEEGFNMNELNEAIEIDQECNQTDSSDTGQNENDEGTVIQNTHQENNELQQQEEEEEDDDDSLPNLSIFGHCSSNNDSSLTTVTGTSGDSSFDLSLNDCSSNSLDNIPNVPSTKP